MQSAPSLRIGWVSARGAVAEWGQVSMGNPAGLGALRKVVALFGAAGVVMGVVGACPAAASVSPSGHPNMGGVPGLPSSGLTLAQAPSALRAAVRRTLGVPALRPASTFQQAELTAADGAPGDAFGGSVAISGSTAVVGAPDRNSQTPGRRTCSPGPAPPGPSKPS